MTAAPPAARSLVIDGNAIKLQPCSLYAGHGSAVIEQHHICPQSWWKTAGKPVDTPMAALCGLCHDNTHAAIDGIVRGLDVTALPRRAVALAREGIEIAKAHGLTPAVTL